MALYACEHISERNDDITDYYQMGKKYKSFPFLFFKVSHLVGSIFKMKCTICLNYCVLVN